MSKLLIIAGVTAIVLTFYGVWKVFEKSGEPGWKALIPVYNFYILLRITGFSGWWAAVPAILTISGLNLVTDLGTLVQELFCPVRDLGCGSGWVTWVFESAVTLFNGRLWMERVELALMDANFLFFNVVAVLFLILLYESLKNLSSQFDKDKKFAVGLLILPFIFWPELSSAKSNDAKSSKQQESTLNKILRILLLTASFVLLAVIGGQYYYDISDQGGNLMSEKEYQEIVNSAEKQRDPSVCNQVEAYSNTTPLGIGGERDIKISEDKATESCVEAVKQDTESQGVKPENDLFTQNVPDNWSTYRNNNYGFTFRYPKSWQYQEDSRGDNQHLICLSPKGPTGDCPGLITVNKNTDLESWYQQMYGEENLSRSNISVDGASGILVKDSNDENTTSDRLIFEKGGFVYHIKFFPEYQEKFKKLVSSFRFEKNKNRQEQPQDTIQQTEKKATNTQNKIGNNLTDITFTGEDYNRTLNPWSVYSDQELGIQFGYPEAYKMVSKSGSENTPNRNGLLGRMDTEEKRNRFLKTQNFTGDKSFDSYGLVSGRNQITYTVYDYKFGSNEFSDDDNQYNGERIDLAMDSMIIKLDHVKKQNNVSFYLGPVFGSLDCFSASVYIPRMGKTGVLSIHECRKGESAFEGFNADTKRNLIKRYIEAKYLSTLELIQ